MRKSGFTLVELLVVIAIIGVLVALLLPAVQAAREAARRSTCSNNLRQIGLALHNHHDTYGAFPAGAVNRGTSNRQEFGWTVFILPFIEQKNLYDQLDPANRTLVDVLNNSTDRVLVQTVIDTYRCPSDTTGDTPQGSPQARDFDGTAGVGTNFYGATLNYPGVLGFWDLADNLNNELGAFQTRRVSSVNSHSDATRFADFTDGTSNTFAVGEREQYCSSGVWAGARNVQTGSGPRGMDYVLGRVSIKLNSPGANTGNDGCTEAFSSKHPGGAQFVFADASVHFIPETIGYNNAGISNFNQSPAFTQAQLNNLGVYQRLGIRNDGMVVDAP